MSAIPRGRLKCSAVLLLETESCARQGFKPSIKSIRLYMGSDPLKQELGA
jgi:hypothetical protein